MDKNNRNKNTKQLKNELKFTQDQINLIKNTLARGSTDDELKLFLYQAERTGLDPLTRQIYFVKRGMRSTVQTSIDGFRVIAERSGLYAGQDEPEFEESTAHPIKCTVKVYKFSSTGERYCAGVGVAFWDEYCPPPGQDMLWQRLKHTLLSKCAEALALRKAFPQDLSGLYTTEEMEQSENDNIHQSESIQQEESPAKEINMSSSNNSLKEELPTAKQRSMIQFQRDRVGMTNEELISFAERLGIRDPRGINKKDASKLINALTGEKNKESQQFSNDENAKLRI